MTRFSRRALLVASSALASSTALGQAPRRAPPAPPQPAGRPVGPAQTEPLGRHLEMIRFESEALKGNLIGDPHDRELAVMLPPSYFSAQRRTYPVVYLLHGLGKRRNGHLDSVYAMREAFRRMKDGRLAEFMMVAVDGTTIFGGSYYTNSPTIGNFADYVAREVVSYIDGRYRTRPDHRWRALAGFSMGGHGAIKIAMGYEGIFSRVGSLSGSPMSIRYRKMIYKGALAGHRKPQSVEQLLSDITYEKNWSLAAAYAKAAAFSPNPSKPPFFLDLPFETSGSDEEDPVWQLWWDEDPLSLVARNKKALRNLDLLYFDHGDNETALGTEDFDRELVRYGIGHIHHLFRGDHSDKLPERFARMLRFVGNDWDEL
ncbi:MAG: alpha/beta hydrolase [Myxococcales bacterium]